MMSKEGGCEEGSIEAKINIEGRYKGGSIYSEDI
jgi:hypothetical protein